jgi:putative cell wall-binding protein
MSVSLPSQDRGTLIGGPAEPTSPAMSAHMLPLRSRVHLLVGAVAVVALLLSVVPALPAAAQLAPVIPQTVVPTGEDFATLAYGDPFDFRNAEDMRFLPDRTSNAVNPRLENGELRFGATGGASLLTFVFPGYGGALYMERDGGAIPIDANRFTHVSMRIYSPENKAMSFSYDRCLAPEHSAEFCRESTADVILERGWNTVVRDLREMTAGRTHPWAGQVYAFRMMNVAASGEYRVQYLRLQSAPQVVEIPAVGEVFWDRDSDVGNNTPDNPDWGRVQGNRFPAGAMEPGEYRFYVRAPGGLAVYSDPLRVAARPAPFVLDPDLAGGEDFAEVVNGKPWDFSTPNDIIARGNFTDETFDGNGLTATNAANYPARPAINDPFFYLRMDAPLDANRYHRLTVHTTYEGAFNLADVAGGGTHGRLLWTRSDRDQDRVIQGNKLIESREMVHYPGQQSFTVDLKTPPNPTFLMETDRPERDGWVAGSGMVTHLRYDPNEDRGPRRWRVSRIAIRATDEARGSFNIRWHDPSGAENVSVTLAYRPEAGGPETVIASGIPQRAGENTFRWDTAGVAPGRYVVVITGDDGVSQGRNVSTGPVDVRSSMRVAGADRLSTAVALSRASFPTGAPAAVVARSDAFPDALAAAPLASAAGGPLLLNNRDSLADSVRDELRRLGVQTVYVMGGEGAQASAVIDQIRALGSVQVVRIAGIDRFRTAAAAAEQAVDLWRAQGYASAGTHAMVALGDDFPDALAAGPLAAQDQRPLLLSSRGDLPAATAEALGRMGARRVTLIGGQAALHGTVEQALLGLGSTVDRIAGATRHETAELAAVAATHAGASPTTVVVASGRAFPDALSAGPAVAQMGGVLLLTERDSLPAPTAAWVSSRRPLQLLRIAGGAAAVSNSVEEALFAALR